MTLRNNIFPVPGIEWATAAAGIRARRAGEPRPDLALMKIAAGSSASAVFTRNAFAAAPVLVARRELAAFQSDTNAPELYCLVNAGNANAGTGSAGIAAAEQSCKQLLACAEAQNPARQARALPFSTGVIGEPLPLQKIEAALPGLLAKLNVECWQAAAQAIMTTDTVPKLASRKVALSGGEVVITGIAKGAGMIKPNMATMLAYVATDARLLPADTDSLLKAAVQCSFNRITVDGDTSTNDACLFAATGASGVAVAQGSADWRVYSEALNGLFIDLATDIIRDAEGASKFITIDVFGGRDSDECLRAAYAVAESPLVKTAFFASDANWGRILAAVGRAGLENLDIASVVLMLDDYCICRDGARPVDYDEVHASAIMARAEIRIGIELGRGTASERVWTSDLSHDYVRINAEYRT